MAYERSKSALDNFGKFIYQLQHKDKTLVWKLERILINYIDKMCLYQLNPTDLNDGLLHIYIYIYIYIYMWKENSTDGHYVITNLFQQAGNVACLFR